MSTASSGAAEWKYPLILLAAVVLVYLQSLSFEFVNYDDPDLVSQNGEFLANPVNALKAFTTHAFTSHREESAYYRPVLLVSYIIDYQVWQLNPLGYHLTNLLIHAAAAFFLFRLLVAMGLDQLAALAASMLFALHPVQTESVAWIAGRNDALVGLFIILMMYWYVERDTKPATAGRSTILSAGAFLLALFTKESAAFFIVLPALYELVVKRTPPGVLLAGGRRTLAIAYGATLAGYLLIRLALFGEVIGAERLYGVIPPGTRLMMVPGMFAEHLWLLVAPYRLAVVHPLENVLWFNAPWTIAAYAVVAGFAAALWWSWKRDRTACFALLWVGVGLVPVLNIFPVAVPVLEHRLYISVAGLAIAAVVLVRRFVPESASRIVIGCLIVAAGAGSFLRTPVWKNSENLWTDAIAKEPDASRAFFNLAGYYFEKQQYDKTIGLMIGYLRLKPEDVLGHMKLRQTYLLAGRYPEANAISRRMIALAPHNANRYIEAGMLYERMNMPDSAILVYRAGIAADTSFYQIHARLGTVYEALGEREQAMRSYLIAIRLIETGVENEHPPSEVVGLLRYLYERTGQTAKAQALPAQ
jgi:tetratricopeptide (TPR) repeat protein